jgi:hypothetical protein
MKKINKYGMLSGIVKVIPPEEWKAQQPRLDDQVKTIRVKEPIKQDIMGTSGTYRQANMVHQRSYNLPQWRQLCDQSEHQPPAKRGERRANQDKPSRPPPRSKAVQSVEPSTAPSSKRRRGRPFKTVAKGKRGVTVDTEDGGQSTPDRLPTPVSPSTQQDEGSVKAEYDDEDDAPVKGRMGSRQAKPVSVSSRRKNNRREREGKVDEAAFKDFKYELEGDEFTPERCEELERAYWKTLTYAPPLYGADMPGTLFDERTKSWNLGRLDNILDVLGSNIPGVNSAYLYLGMWKATFAWHLEDVDLYSINYLHFGAPKQWYSIAQPDARRFEAAMRTIWPTDAKACDQFLRHKTFLISPSNLLSNYNIKVNKIVHKPGEFVITFPYGYHSGYNLGYNCAEAVNFGLEEWLQYGRVAKKCDCDQAQDSVWINVHDLERKMRGEETEFEETDEEDEEEEDEEDENDNSTLATIPEHGGLKTKAPRKKRKRPINDKGGKSDAKRTRLRLKVPTKEPCILCPNDIPSEPLLPTGNKGEKVHRICAQYIPETSIEDGKVVDIEYIHKDRMLLKCNYCRSKKGACFQCSRKKCTRAYHATCAAAAGVFVEQGETARFGEDQTEYKEWGIEFSCRFHRAKRDKKHDFDVLSESERIRKAGGALDIGDVCQIQYHKGDIWAGVVVENCKDEEMLLLDVLPRGYVLVDATGISQMLTYFSDRVEVPYTWLLLPDPTDYSLTKPSANAIPMPKSRKDKESLNTSKRQADDLPRAEDPFVEGHTWAEFNREAIPINPHQVKVDISREGQTWFYLGKTSTEAKAQYTENPSVKRHNPKGNFLDTIPKTVIAVPRQSFPASYPTNAKNSTPTPIRPPTRPSMPTYPSSGSLKQDKPYEYKPREAYRIDPQAFHLQQTFVRSAPQPYSFGTDPRYKAPESSSPSASIGYPHSGNNLTPQVSTGGHQNQFRTSQSSLSASTQYGPTQQTTQSQQGSQPHRPVPAYHSTQDQFGTTPQRSPSVSQSQWNSQVQRVPAHAGTPIQYHSPAPRPTTAYHASQTHQSTQPPPHAQVHHPAQPQHVQAQRTPQVQQFAPPAQESPPAPSQHVHQPQPTHGQSTTQAQYQKHHSQFAPPPTQHRKPQVTPTTSKPNNPFGGRPQASRGPSVFSKYPYLQKEHNRSPLEYKSPYRPGGGFMNGYQGSIEEHLKRTMFAQRPSSGVSIPSPSSSNYSSSRPPSNPQNAASSPIYASAYGASYNAHIPSPASSYARSPSMQSQSTKAPLPKAASPPTWEKKETAQLHPAIRQEYHASIFQQQYDPSPHDSPTQSRSSVLQPPQLYERPPYQPSAGQGYDSSQVMHNSAIHSQQAPPQTTYHRHSVPKSLSASHPQQYNRSAEQSVRPQSSSELTLPVHQASNSSTGTVQTSYNTQPSISSATTTPVAGHFQEQAHSVANVGDPSSVTAPSAQIHDNSLPTPQFTQSQTGASNLTSPHDAAASSKAQSLSQKMTPQARTAAHLAQSLTLPPNYKPTTILPPPKAYSVSRSPESQSKPVFPHQQNFQQPGVPSQYPPSAQSTTYQNFEPADVPPNSSALIEQMMKNLRKARAGS